MARTRTFIGVVDLHNRSPRHYYCTMRPNSDKPVPWLNLENIAELMYLRYGRKGEDYSDFVTFEVPSGFRHLSRLSKIEEEHFKRACEQHSSI